MGSCVAPSSQNNGSGGAIPAPAAVNVTYPAKLVLSCTRHVTGVPPLCMGKCLYLAGFMELYGLSALSPKKVSNFFSLESHPIPSRKAGWLNTFLYCVGERKRKQVILCIGYYGIS